MQCLVTGGAGFIGSNLVYRLINDGHFVRVIDDLSSGNMYNLHPNAEFHRIDISDNAFFDMFEDIDVVFHFAAFPRVEPSIKDPIKSHRINVNGTLNVLKACIDYKVKRFVFTSSSAIYGEAETPTVEEHHVYPMSPYALHKLIGEQYCRLFSDLYKLETVSLRYSNVYGENQPTEGPYCNVMGIFEQQKADGKPMTIVGDGEQRRDFTHVDDIVDGLIKCGIELKTNDNSKANGETFELGRGINYSINEVANMFGGEKKYIDQKPGEVRDTLCVDLKAKEILKWNPKENLEDYINKIV